MVDRLTVDKTVFDWKVDDVSSDSEQFTFTARPDLGRFPIHLSKDEWVDFIELTLADWLEQVQGAAETPSAVFQWKKGEAYAYRRTAYAKMAEILSHERRDRLGDVVKQMHADIYGTEGGETRHLVQLRTPPPSDAATKALDALRSAGEDIPLSFEPQPITLMSDKDAVVDSLNRANVYETDNLLNMYLGFHYPHSKTWQGGTPAMENFKSPPLVRGVMQSMQGSGLMFPQRVVGLLISLSPKRTNNRALDVGCAVGGASFELARHFEHIEAFDFR